MFVNGTWIKLVMGRAPTVDGQELAAHQLVDFRFDGGHLVYNGLNTVVLFDGGLIIVWDGGSSSSLLTYLLLLLLLLLLQAFSALTLRLRLRMADPCTKFEVSSVSRCGDITWGVKF